MILFRNSNFYLQYHALYKIYIFDQVLLVLILLVDKSYMRAVVYCIFYREINHEVIYLMFQYLKMDTYFHLVLCPLIDMLIFLLDLNFPLLIFLFLVKLIFLI